jgi:hypothetical protein
LSAGGPTVFDSWASAAAPVRPRIKAPKAAPLRLRRLVGMWFGMSLLSLAFF